MSDRNKADDLEGLVRTTTDSLAQQQQKAEASAAGRPPRSRPRLVLMLILVSVFAGALYVQYPRIVEPYALPDARTNPMVVEADLILIGELIEAFRLSQGKYPDSLGQVQLPAALAQLVARFPLEYRLGETSFTLEWKPYRWHAMYDGDTGEIDVNPAKIES